MVVERSVFRTLWVSQSLFPALSLWWTHEAAGMEQKRWFLYACACFGVSKIVVVIFNTLFFRV